MGVRVEAGVGRRGAWRVRAAAPRPSRGARNGRRASGQSVVPRGAALHRRRAPRALHHAPRALLCDSRVALTRVVVLYDGTA